MVQTITSECEDVEFICAQLADLEPTVWDALSGIFQLEQVFVTNLQNQTKLDPLMATWSATLVYRQPYELGYFNVFSTDYGTLAIDESRIGLACTESVVRALIRAVDQS